MNLNIPRKVLTSGDAEEKGLDHVGHFFSFLWISSLHLSSNMLPPHIFLVQAHSGLFGRIRRGAFYILTLY